MYNVVGDSKVYTKEEKAIHLVFLAFKNQNRIKEDINMAFHSISTGFILKNLGCDEDTVVTGMLHDIIEDTNYTYDHIEKMFNKKIADDVEKVSENNNIKNWLERKKEFISRIKTYDDNLILVELADKSQNLLSDYHLFLNNGKEALLTSNKNFSDLKWYYLELQNIFNDRLEKNTLLDRYNNLINLYFND